MKEKRIWLIDATTYHRELTADLCKLKEQFYQIKAYVRNVRLGEKLNIQNPRKGYSIGLLRIFSILRRLPNCNIAYYDLDSAEEQIAKLERNEIETPDIIGFSAVTPTIQTCADLAVRVRSAGKNIRLVIGGAHARIAPNRTKKEVVQKDGSKIFDDVISSSGCKAVSELLESRETDIPKFRGFIDYNLIKLSESCVNIFAGMGCPYQCIYCQDQFSDNGDSVLSPEVFQDWFKETIDKLHAELQWTKDPYPVHFCDSEFGGNVDRTIKLCQLIKDTFPNHNMLLSCDLRAEFINQKPDKLIRNLLEAGFREVRIGLDSAENKVLEYLNRTATQETVLQAIKNIRDYENRNNITTDNKRIYISLYIVTGLPGSTKDSDLKTQRFVTDLLENKGIDQVKHHIYVPYPCDPDKGHYYVPQGVTLEDNDWQDWKNYDRQSIPVYSLPNYSRDAIWNQFLATEEEIIKAWRKAWPKAAYNKKRYGDYNVFYYIEHKPAPPTPKEYVSILYLSDLHLTNIEGNMATDQKTELEEYQGKRYSDLFIDQLKILEKPDFVVVSGDITVQGNNEGFAEFNELVEKMILEGKFSKDPRRILIVPGNHDRNDKTKFNLYEKAFGRRYTHPPLDQHDSILQLEDENLFDLLNSSAQGNNGIVGGKINGISLPFVLDTKKLILLYGFNSAMISRSSVKMPKKIQDVLNELKTPNAKSYIKKEYIVDPAVIINDELKLFHKLMEKTLPRFIEKSCPEVDLASVVKVAVFHHPVALLPTCTEVKEFGYFLNAGEVKRDLHKRGFRVILHGHNHWPEAYYESAVSGGGSFLVMSGGTICDCVPEQNNSKRGFYWVKCFPKSSEVEYQYIELQDSPAVGWPEKVRMKIPDPDKSKVPSRFKEISTYTAYRLLCDKLRRESADEVGWAHNLNDNSVETVGTAFGLLIMSLMKSHSILFLEKKEAIIKTLINRRLTNEGKGWAQSKPKGEDQKTGRPDITAWVLEALHAWGEDDPVRQGLHDLEWLLDDKGNQPILSAYTLSLILRILAKVAPDSSKIHWLSTSLIKLAERSGGKIKYWCCSEKKNEPSVAHTAHAIIALLRANGATNGEFGLEAKGLETAIKWLHEQQSLDTQQEDIAFDSKVDNKRDELRVWHYTKPWVVIALLEMGLKANDAKIEGVIREILDDQDPSERGLWNLRKDGVVSKKLPVWATYDALSALQKYEMGLSFVG